MKIVNPTYTIIDELNYEEVKKKIERIARVCYKSEDKIEDGSADKIISMLIQKGHEAMLEHFSFSVLFIVDRGISHEIVRHRIASFAQESTRYCNYSKDKFGNEITVVCPTCFYNNIFAHQYWYESCKEAEDRYFSLLECGVSPQDARSVLPTSLKTEIVMTANLREWRHFLKLRTSKAAHPQMREIAIPLLFELSEKLPIFFNDIENEFKESEFKNVQ